MDKIYYKQIRSTGVPSGHVRYVKNNEEAENFHLIYQPEDKKWIVFFALKTSARSIPKYQIFTKRGTPKLFSLQGAFTCINENSTAGSFQAFFDPDLSPMQIANLPVKQSTD